MAVEFTDYLHSLARRLHLEPNQEQDIILELEGHLEDKAADLEAGGLDRDAALRIAVEEMGAPETVASGMYAVHSPGVWRDVMLAIIPHFLLAALFALHLWSHYFLVALLLIGIALVTWRNWRAGNPSKWSYSWMGYTLAAPALSWLLSLIALAYGGWTLVTTGSLPFNVVLFVLLIGYVPFSMWIVFGAARKVMQRDWLLASLTALSLPLPDFLGPFPQLAGRPLERPRRGDAEHRHRAGVHFPGLGCHHGGISQGRPPFVQDWPAYPHYRRFGRHLRRVSSRFVGLPRNPADDSSLSRFPPQSCGAGVAPERPLCAQGAGPHRRPGSDPLVQRHDVAVVVDSSCCLPPELLRQWHITVVPHQLVIGDRAFRDGLDISPDEFYRLIAQDQSPSMSTSAPQPGHFQEGFVAASELAPNVLCLTLPTEFSAGYRSACAAAESSNGSLANVNVQVLDSRAAAGGSGLVALAAARWAAAGLCLDDIVARVEQLAPRVRSPGFSGHRALPQAQRPRAGAGRLGRRVAQH